MNDNQIPPNLVTPHHYVEPKEVLTEEAKKTPTFKLTKWEWIYETWRIYRPRCAGEVVTAKAARIHTLKNRVRDLTKTLHKRRQEIESLKRWKQKPSAKPVEDRIIKEIEAAEKQLKLITRESEKTLDLEAQKNRELKRAASERAGFEGEGLNLAKEIKEYEEEKERLSTTVQSRVVKAIDVAAQINADLKKAKKGAGKGLSSARVSLLSAYTGLRVLEDLQPKLEEFSPGEKERAWDKAHIYQELCQGFQETARTFFTPTKTQAELLDLINKCSDREAVQVLTELNPHTVADLWDHLQAQALVVDNPPDQLKLTTFEEHLKQLESQSPAIFQAINGQRAPAIKAHIAKRAAQAAKAPERQQQEESKAASDLSLNFTVGEPIKTQVRIDIVTQMERKYRSSVVLPVEQVANRKMGELRNVALVAENLMAHASPLKSEARESLLTIHQAIRTLKAALEEAPDEETAREIEQLHNSCAAKFHRLVTDQQLLAIPKRHSNSFAGKMEHLECLQMNILINDRLGYQSKLDLLIQMRTVETELSPADKEALQELRKHSVIHRSFSEKYPADHLESDIAYAAVLIRGCEKAVTMLERHPYIASAIIQHNLKEFARIAIVLEPKAKAKQLNPLVHAIYNNIKEISAQLTLLDLPETKLTGSPQEAFSERQIFEQATVHLTHVDAYKRMLKKCFARANIDTDPSAFRELAILVSKLDLDADPSIVKKVGKDNEARQIMQKVRDASLFIGMARNVIESGDRRKAKELVEIVEVLGAMDLETFDVIDEIREVSANARDFLIPDLEDLVAHEPEVFQTRRTQRRDLQAHIESGLQTLESLQNHPHKDDQLQQRAVLHTLEFLSESFAKFQTVAHREQYHPLELAHDASLFKLSDEEELLWGQCQVAFKLTDKHSDEYTYIANLWKMTRDQKLFEMLLSALLTKLEGRALFCASQDERDQAREAVTAIEAGLQWLVGNREQFNANRRKASLISKEYFEPEPKGPRGLREIFKLSQATSEPKSEGETKVARDLGGMPVKVPVSVSEGETKETRDLSGTILKVPVLKPETPKPAAAEMESKAEKAGVPKKTITASPISLDLTVPARKAKRIALEKAVEEAKERVKALDELEKSYLAQGLKEIVGLQKAEEEQASAETTLLHFLEENPDLD